MFRKWGGAMGRMMKGEGAVGVRSVSKHQGKVQMETA